MEELDSVQKLTEFNFRVFFTCEYPELPKFLFQNLASWTWMSLLKSLYIYKKFILITSNVHDVVKRKSIA